MLIKRYCLSCCERVVGVDGYIEHVGVCACHWDRHVGAGEAEVEGLGCSYISTQAGYLICLERPVVRTRDQLLAVEGESVVAQGEIDAWEFHSDAFGHTGYELRVLYCHKRYLSSETQYLAFLVENASKSPELQVEIVVP